MAELLDIERPYKRPRLHYESSGAELKHKRARHDLHLKSRFEEIFRKYEKDFSETADEIDLETGEIVVNKGHLAAMVDEFDPGQDSPSASHQQPDLGNTVNTADGHGSQGTDWINNEEEDIAACSMFNGITQALSSSNDVRSETAADSSKPPRDYSSDRRTPGNGEHQSGPHKTDRRGHRQLLYPSSTNGHHFQSNTADNNSGGFYQAERLSKLALESAWQAPPLPVDRSRSFFYPELPSTSADESERGRSPSPPVGSLWAPVADRGRPRSYGPATQRRRPPISREPLPQLELPVFDLGPKQHVPSQPRPKQWLQEEDELLIKLRTTTQLTYREMAPYFTGRSLYSIACHWSRALRCGERYRHLNGGNDVEPMASRESGEGITLHDQSPYNKSRNRESSTGVCGISDYSTLPSKLRSKAHARTSLLSNLRPVSSEQRLDTTSDFDDELGDYPLAKKLSAIHLTKSSPVPACSRTYSVVSATKALEPRKAATLGTIQVQIEKHQPIHKTPSHTTSPVPPSSCTNPAVSTTKTMKPRETTTARTTHPQIKKQQSLNRTPSHTTVPALTCSSTNPVVSTTEMMKPREIATPKTTNPRTKKHRPLNKTPAHTVPLDDNGELSDSCELGLSPPRERASAPSHRTQTRRLAVTPLPFGKDKQPSLLGKAMKISKPVVTEDSSEDELATPIKTIGTPQAWTKKLCSGSRRSTSYW